MLANGVHETATPGSLLQVALTPGGDNGDRRVSEAFPVVGQTFQCVLMSTSSGLWEEGFYTVVAGNKLDRTAVTRNSSGTTARIDFGAETVDVLPTPTDGAASALPLIIPSQMTSSAVFADNLMLSTHLTGSRSSATQTANRLYLLPHLVGSAAEIRGFWFHSSLDMSAMVCRLALVEYSATGGIGAVLAETSGFSPAGTGYKSKLLAVPIKPPASKFLLAYICDSASQISQWESEVHPGPFSISSANPMSALYKNMSAGWTDVPAIPGDMTVSNGGGMCTVGVVV